MDRMRRQREKEREMVMEMKKEEPLLTIVHVLGIALCPRALQLARSVFGPLYF